MKRIFDTDKTHDGETIAPEIFVQSSNVSKDVKPLVSLEIGEDESIKDAEADMEQFIKLMWNQWC